MSKRVQIVLVGLVCFLFGCLLAPHLPFVNAQQDTGKKPTFLHGLDLQVRKGGVKEFTNADKFGIEVFRDENTGNLIYISEKGSIAVVPAK